MKSDVYKENLVETISKLVAIRQEIFDMLFRVAITGELKEWGDDVEEGEQFTFTKEMFEGCSDNNMQLLVKLMSKVENTADSLCNLNNIDFPTHQRDEDDD